MTKKQPPPPAYDWDIETFASFVAKHNEAKKELARLERANKAFKRLNTEWGANINISNELLVRRVTAVLQDMYNIVKEKTRAGTLAKQAQKGGNNSVKARGAFSQDDHDRWRQAQARLNEQEPDTKTKSKKEQARHLIAHAQQYGLGDYDFSSDYAYRVLTEQLNNTRQRKHVKKT